jgi:diguanylate cyclase (GGDEF)-like protein
VGIRGRTILILATVAVGLWAAAYGLSILMGANIPLGTMVVLGALGAVVTGAVGLSFETLVFPDRVRALQSQSILGIAGDSMAHLNDGLTPQAASEICKLVLGHTNASAVAITDMDTVLGFEGAGSDHHEVGGPIVTEATREALATNRRKIIRNRADIACPEATCPLRAAVIVPLQSGDLVRGTLKFYYSAPRRLNRTAIALADGLGRLLSMQLELDRSRSELAYLAGHDPLTGLKNRRHFEGELRRELSEERRMGGSGALLWFDLDHFKDINDCLGHAAGDKLLVAFADLLRASSRSYCTLARLGGDEFGMLLPHANEAEAEGAAARLVDLLSANTFAVDGHEVRISASIGVVRYPEHGWDGDQLMARADLAMYEAKATGGNRVVAYQHDETWRSRMTDHIDLAERIVAALREDRFVLYAQPLRCLADGLVGGYELLLRMVGEDGEIIMPSEIIPTAERLGVIRDIDRWVARRSIALLAEARDNGVDTTFSINLSGCAFSDPDLLDIISGELARTCVDPWRLVIEITETTAIADIERARRFVAALRDLGCKFSLDDFGSGASSFYYLKHLAVDYLKLDGSLVKGLDALSPDAHFVRAIVEMCKGLSISTVAEYVESEDLLAAVGAHGVDYAQGYEVGLPQPIGWYMSGPSLFPHPVATTGPMATLAASVVDGGEACPAAGVA